MPWSNIFSITKVQELDLSCCIKQLNREIKMLHICTDKCELFLHFSMPF